MTNEQLALHLLIERADRTRVNTVQAANQRRTKPTEWQPVIWLEKLQAEVNR